MAHSLGSWIKRATYRACGFYYYPSTFDWVIFNNSIPLPESQVLEENLPVVSPLQNVWLPRDI